MQGSHLLNAMVPLRTALHRFMSVLIRDLKLILRRLLRTPVFTLTAVLMLTLGIGATTAIFSIVEGVLLRPLPFPEPQRLVSLTDQYIDSSAPSDDTGVSGPEIASYVRGTHSFNSLGGYVRTRYEITGLGEPQNISAARLGAGVFRALGVAPLLGRSFTQEEDDNGRAVTVLSYSLWQRDFRGDQQVLRRKIVLNRISYVIIGVMPRNFEFPLVSGSANISALWVPLSLNSRDLTGDGLVNFDLTMVGRLKVGVSPEQAQRDAQRVAEQTMRGFPASIRYLELRALVRPLKEEAVTGARALVRTLFFAVVVVLLLACANLAGLLLVRAIRRRHEVAICMALGASGTMLVRQAFVESLVLSASGGIFGLLLASIALPMGVKLLPETLPRVNEIALDWEVMAFAFALALFTGILCGLAPAFAVLHTGVGESLKVGGRTGAAGGRHVRLRSALVIAEIAIALVLVTCAGLLLRSFKRMREANLGFRPDHVIAAAYNLPEKQYGTVAAIDNFTADLQQRLERIPGVTLVGFTSYLPQYGSEDTIIYQAEGHTLPQDISHFAVSPLVSGDYFQAMGIPLLRGRFFTADDTANAPLVAIVNQKIAEHFWPGESPIGKRIYWGRRETPMPWMTIVGEVANVRQDTPDGDFVEQIYQPVQQRNASFGSFSTATTPRGGAGYVVLRSSLNDKQAEDELRATVRSVDKLLPLGQLQSMREAVSEGEEPRRFNTAIISVFATAAVVLAVLGIYSIITFSAALRMQEMAIRLALGSPRSHILKAIVGSAAKLACTGAAIGLLGALAASRLLQSFLFEVSPFDPLVMALAVIVIVALALAASVIPAQRAASIDPVQALRSE